MPSPLWSHRLSAAAIGMAYSRESGHTLVWDGHHWLVLINRRGSVQVQVRRTTAIAAAASADDGSAFAIADHESVAWLHSDLSPRWSKRLSNRPTALALDPLGRCLAIADVSNRLHLIDKSGRFYGEVPTPRPLYHLHFLGAEPLLIAAADFGLIAGLDIRNRQWTWQDSPVIHLGDIAASDRGDCIGAACFSEGIRRYDAGGKSQPVLPTAQPCRYVGITADGQRFLTGSIRGLVSGLSAQGQTWLEQRFETPLIGVALAPLGDMGIVGLSEGRIVGLDFASELK